MTKGAIDGVKKDGIEDKITGSPGYKKSLVLIRGGVSPPQGPKGDLIILGNRSKKEKAQSYK